MAKQSTQWSKLDNALLIQDEEEYDKTATEISQQYGKASELETQNLDDLDPSHQAIQFLYVLSAHIDSSIKSGKALSRQLPISILPDGRLWPHIARFLSTFDPIQVRYAGHVFTRVIETVARGAEQTQDYVPALQLLGTAILRLDPTSSTLTTTHLYYIRLSLLAGAYENALAILDLPIFSIPSTEITKQVGNRAFKYLCSIHEFSSTYLSPATGLTQKITSRMYLEYFLMGAMCYLGSIQYKKALLFLEIVLTTPSSQNAVSVVQLEAYKKWLLLNLLVYGKPGRVPASLSQAVHRHLRAAAKPYECVVEAFKSAKIDRLQAEIQEGLQLWQDDDNYGLLHEVFAAFRKYSVIRLGKVYAAVTLNEVARMTSTDPHNVQETATYIAALIQAGELQAVLVPAQALGESILRYASEQEYSVPESHIEQEMVARTHDLQQLLTNISRLDHQMAVHREYIELLQKLRNARDREKKGTVSANRSILADVHDEDMMDDL